MHGNAGIVSELGIIIVGQASFSRRVNIPSPGALPYVT